MNSQPVCGSQNSVLSTNPLATYLVSPTDLALAFVEVYTQYQELSSKDSVGQNTSKWREE